MAKGAQLGDVENSLATAQALDDRKVLLEKAVADNDRAG